MQQQDKPAFVATLNGLAAVKPGKPLTPDGLEIYWLALQDWSLTDFKQAAAQLSKSVEFMPNPYHFEQLRKAGQPTPGEAFAKARVALKAAMPSQFLSLSCGDPLIDSAIRACGGYEALAMCTTENIGFFERRFAEHFETVSDSTEVRQALPFIKSFDEPPMKQVNGPRRLFGS